MFFFFFQYFRSFHHFLCTSVYMSFIPFSFHKKSISSRSPCLYIYIHIFIRKYYLLFVVKIFFFSYTTYLRFCCDDVHHYTEFTHTTESPHRNIYAFKHSWFMLSAWCFHFMCIIPFAFASSSTPSSLSSLTLHRFYRGLCIHYIACIIYAML